MAAALHTFEERQQPAPVSVRAQAALELRRRARQHIPECEKCADSFLYFILNYCQIYDATAKVWIPFTLWLEQQQVAEALTVYRLVIILKARQLGMTWLVLAYALWLMLFHPVATILIFSLRDTEAVYLLGAERLRGMYKRLPVWMMYRARHEHNQACKPDCALVYDWQQRSVIKDDGHVWQLGNDSVARAFPTSAGDSYTATLAIVDEADLVPDLAALLLRVQPTIDAGGQLFLVSKANKELPQSEFKRIYKAAKRGVINWFHVFLPWQVRPSRTPEWYQAQVQQALETQGSLDAVWENYPATDDEALARKSTNQRVPFMLFKRVYDERKPLDWQEVPSAPFINGLRIYKPRIKGRKYCAGADPAEGNPNSDDSVLDIVYQDTGEQVAVLKGKYEISIFVTYIEQLCAYFNGAPVLVERNNHGHAVIKLLDEHKKVVLIKGTDGKQGWLDNERGKTELYDSYVDTIRSLDCIIHDVDTSEQVQSIEGNTLRAPKGLPDDCADADALAQIGRRLAPKTAPPPSVGAKRAALVSYTPR